MHECPSCGFDCDCDGEDTVRDTPPEDCLCDCDVDCCDEDDWDDGDYHEGMFLDPTQPSVTPVGHPEPERSE